MPRLLSYRRLQQKQGASCVQIGYSDHCHGQRMEMSCWHAVTLTYKPGCPGQDATPAVEHTPRRCCHTLPVAAELTSVSREKARHTLVLILGLPLQGIVSRPGMTRV